MKKESSHTRYLKWARDIKRKQKRHKKYMRKHLKKSMHHDLEKAERPLPGLLEMYI